MRYNKANPVKRKARGIDSSRVMHYSKVIQFFKQPYPFETTRYSKLKIIITACVFVFLFLLIFQPFGLKYLGSDTLLLRVGEYVVFIFIVLCFNVLVLPGIFKDFFSDENWTIFKNVLFALFNIAVIGFCSLFYANLRGNVQLTFRNLIHFEFYTLLIGGFPATFFLSLNHIHSLKEHLKAAEKLNQSLRHESPYEGNFDNNLITLISENGRDIKTMDANRIVLFASADNYVNIFSERENKMEKELLRSSLARIEEALREYPVFFRCHRAYIINLRKIKAVSGNSQGYSLVFDKLDEQIPVARGQVKKFNERMAAFTRE